MFRLVVLPCFDYVGLTVSMQILSLELGVIGGLITPVHSLMLNSSLPVYQVRLDWLPLPLDSTKPLSCLGSSVVEHLPSKQYVVGLSPT